MALHACSYFALWETFSLATVANLSTFEKVGANSSPAVEHVHSPPLASSSPNYPGAMRHVRMYSSCHCQACFQPVLFNWSSLWRYAKGKQGEGKGFLSRVGAFVLHGLIKGVYNVNACAIMGDKASPEALFYVTGSTRTWAVWIRKYSIQWGLSEKLFVLKEEKKLTGSDAFV